MPGRSYSTPSYRYGFNGKEKDDEVKGNGNSLDFGERVHDPRLGRFLSIDPLASQYCWNTPFGFADNSPIRFIEVEGKYFDWSNLSSENRTKIEAHLAVLREDKLFAYIYNRLDASPKVYAIQSVDIPAQNPAQYGASSEKSTRCSECCRRFGRHNSELTNGKEYLTQDYILNTQRKITTRFNFIIFF